MPLFKAPAFQIDLQREALAASSLNHPPGFRRDDVGETNGWPVPVMELVEVAATHYFLLAGPMDVATGDCRLASKWQKRWRLRTPKA